MFDISSLNTEIIFWLVCMIIFIVAELITVGLTSIWFAAGALCALLVAACGGNMIVQIIVFLVVAIVLLFATRPWAKRFINSRVTKTNSDSLVGKEIRITERVNNVDQTGTAVVNGQEWTVRADDDNTILEVGEMAKVVRISGVKLIVERV